MAERLTDKQKKLIVADYAEMENYSAVARKHHVARSTVKRLIEGSPDVAEMTNIKKAENTADMLAYMDQKKGQAQTVIDLCLEFLQNKKKFERASIQQIATVMAIVVDKFTAFREMSEEKQDKRLEEIAKQLEEYGKK